MWNLSITRTILCRIKSRTFTPPLPPAHGAGERDYGLAPCNPVFLTTFSCSALPGTESGLVDYSSVDIWAVNVVKIRFRLGFQILFRRLLRRGQRFRCCLRVFALLLVVFHSLLLRDRFMFTSLSWTHPDLLRLFVSVRGLMKVLLSLLLASKPCCILELCYIDLQSPRYSTVGVQHNATH
jgi:hypothetical protein